MVVPNYSEKKYIPAKQEESVCVEANQTNLTPEVKSKRDNKCWKLFIISGKIAFAFSFVVLLVTVLKCMNDSGFKIWFGVKETQTESRLKEIAPSTLFKSNSTKAAIFWNFDTGYQTVKYSSDGQKICYIFKLDDTSPRLALQSDETKKVLKSRVFDVIHETSHLKNNMTSLIGQPAYHACKDVKVMWLVQFDEKTGSDQATSSHHESDWIPKTATGNDLEVLVRNKRNIRTCRTSCCYRVCCCDVHHFIWETIEEFNCNHVCVRCSKSYHPVIQKIC